MCPTPKVPKATQYQTQKEAILPEDEEEQAARRGRRGTILSEAVSAPTGNAGMGKTLLGQ